MRSVDEIVQLSNARLMNPGNLITVIKKFMPTNQNHANMTIAMFPATGKDFSPANDEPRNRKTITDATIKSCLKLR